MSRDYADNHSELLGIVSDEPEYFTEGKQKVLYVYVAVDRHHRDVKDAIPVRIYGAKAEPLSRVLDVGDLIQFHGALRVGRARASGVPYTFTQVYVRASSYVLFDRAGGIRMSA